LPPHSTYSAADALGVTAKVRTFLSSGIKATCCSTPYFGKMFESNQRRDRLCLTFPDITSRNFDFNNFAVWLPSRAGGHFQPPPLLFT
jgi:hypothetical protein